MLKHRSIILISALESSANHAERTERASTVDVYGDVGDLTALAFSSVGRGGWERTFSIEVVFARAGEKGWKMIGCYSGSFFKRVVSE
jgi:hypothetical protein